jgi:hypothetical protein
MKASFHLVERAKKPVEVDPVTQKPATELVEYVTISEYDEHKSVVDRLATDEDRGRFHKAYVAFQASLVVPAVVEEPLALPPASTPVEGEQK